MIPDPVQTTPMKIVFGANFGVHAEIDGAALIHGMDIARNTA